MPARNLDRSLIRDLPIFRSMAEDDLDAVLAAAALRRLPQNSPAFVQGAPATEFFALLHGRLKVVQTTPDGQQVIVRHVNPGDIFGIARAMRRTDYPATALAIIDSLALAWPSSQWESFLGHSPALAANALAMVGQRLQDAHARIRELSTEEVERRVAHALLRLARQAGRATEAGLLIDFPITRQDIAEMTGTTLHTVSRVMSAWEAQGLVASDRKRITVRDSRKLLALAEQLPA
ncbi:Crp/Fnr family transcriptional regulator [Geminicoccus roseus]|uniref:Crp/Fnr family transcriptional regulator n=1 Tax=Geminicoccus roseus TaxID=404900 RepID=UPI000403C4B2|nr:Crp/Fnr family transcriptional regulator [Geminicoccus roseus]